MTKNILTKPTNMSWIPYIPKDWDMIKMRYIGNLYSGLTGKKGSDFGITNEKHRYIPFTSIASDLIVNTSKLDNVSISQSEIQNQVLKSDILFLMSSETQEDIGKCSIVSESIPNVYLNSFCKGFRMVDSEVDPLYLNYLLNSRLYRQLILIEGKGFTRINLRQNAIYNLNIMKPPLLIQQKITDYLDLKVTKINHFIAQKLRLIDLLKEQRQSVITRAITKGVSENKEFKFSGIQWLGDIPKHWKVMKLKHIGQSIIGLIYSPLDIVEKDKGILVLRSSNIQNGVFSEKDSVFVKRFIPKNLYTRRGDILLCSRNGSAELVGKNILIDSATEGHTFGAFMTIFRSEINSFLYFFFNSNMFKSQTALFATTTINQLTNSILGNLQIAYPESKEEQLEIITYIQRETASIDLAIDKTQRELELVREYKESLITEAVTGQLSMP